jgi:hypothetical protein
MQKPTIAVLLAVLLTVPALAAPAASGDSPWGPLPPGGPAGARNAQISNNETLFIGAAVLVIGIGLYLASGNYKLPGGSSGGSGGGTTTPPPATTTTTTTTR